MMGKNITDYLHLCLGGRCMWRVLGGSEWKETGIDLKILDRLYDNQPFEIKPILRPLSDMTEEESIECERVSNGDNAGYYFAEKTKWLLSKHFDLFGLIESGLAIDKTTLK